MGRCSLNLKAACFNPYIDFKRHTILPSGSSMKIGSSKSPYKKAVEMSAVDISQFLWLAILNNNITAFLWQVEAYVSLYVEGSCRSPLATRRTLYFLIDPSA